MKSKILIVEDNDINRKILAQMLKKEYEIIEAIDGLEAFDIIQAQYSDISAVILDLLMPRMNGKELLEILGKEKQYSNMPILIATGEHDEKIESECLQLGAWDFITKPYNPIVLTLRLHNIIGRSQTHLLKQIQRLAERDTLTDVYNRRFFMKETAKMLKAHPDETFVMIRMDVDQFRLYNASFGSEAGDELIKRLSEQIKERLEEYDPPCKCYGRIDADIFGVCVPYRKERLEASLLKTEQEIQKFHDSYRLKVSFGMYIIEDLNQDMEKIYANSTEAVQKCKNNINRVFAYYDKEMGKREERAQVLTNEFEHALKTGQFQVYLQPKYSIETNRPCGSEALVRWKHPKWGMTSPGEFIPVFEQNGLIIQLDYYMWENVCATLKKWRAEHMSIFPISVNVSRISLYNPQIVENLIALTDRYQIPRNFLNLEITESAYMSNPRLMKEIINKLRSNGFVILMDDFGSEYSSLNTLKDIEVDILKIDMKFLPNGQNNVKSEKILASITRMADLLGLPVVVEGVETKDQRDFLESIGCQYIQGFYYARPMPIVDYEILINKTENHMVREVRKQLSNQPKSFDSIWNVKEWIRFMSGIFELVRLVDPKETAVITIKENGTIQRASYSCFSVWGKTVRCENCSSICAATGHCKLNKFELLKNDIFYVVSQPVKIYMGNGKSEELVLEIASRLLGDQALAAQDTGSIYHYIENIHSKIYTDPLTGAYNRRFLDEMLFLHHGQNSLASQVAVIIFDLYKFKQINDLYGHQAGDKVLKDVVITLKRQIRSNDSLIRFGGDEFVIILTNCEDAYIKASVERFEKAIATVKYGPEHEMSVQADFGYAYVEGFNRNSKQLFDMINEADNIMYEQKRTHKTETEQNT